MDPIMGQHLDNLWSTDRARQNAAFFAVIEATEQPVDWAYEEWDDLLATLRHGDNHHRAIAAQVLCNLAKSDPQYRMRQDFDALLNVTRDERFVTARHCLQSLWKVGAAGKQQQQQVLDGLSRRFHECAAEKNSTLIRYDIVRGLRKLYDVVHDETIRETALALIAAEDDVKYRRKYAGLWRAKKSASVE